MENIQHNIEALIFASEQSLSLADIRAILTNHFKEDVPEELILSSLEVIREKHQSEESVFELVEMSGGYQFLSKKEYHDILNLLIIHKEKKKLSTAAMETLAIIAYKQPITKTEVELIRGVNCDYSVQKLLEKDLISISGRSSAPGKPILYETSVSFMDHFGLRSPKDLPQLKDIQNPENSINPEDGLMQPELLPAPEDIPLVTEENTEEQTHPENNIEPDTDKDSRSE